ncbi:alpha/beta hydrolase [Candidatus Nanohalobium constans]|uniref:Alpha/beta hydrolase fold protein n=1 Tax=Candidatus Nanohalobium constans TaxID=2565781 RepID=A0A5Q0UER1_9ARCH|nr:alpha/beta hydrolase [Candidatus Nanohalobium constans]QGA80038.1 alpha/beta hydrolase fold protein [Candidatus Nanohalobium constans]
MKEYSIEAENGEKVAVTHEEADSDTWIFVCHGFGGNKERQSEYLELAEESFNVVTLSFRGNGDSDGEFIDQDLSSRIKDLEAVVNYFEPENTILFGTSFGGKVVFHTAEDIDVDAVIGKAPVTYKEIMDKFREVVEAKGRFEYIDGKPIDESFFDDFDSYDFEELENSLYIPVAIFHGAADTTVHPEFSFEAAEKLDTSVMLDKIEGEKHSFSRDGKEYMFGQMVAWLDNNELTPE